MRGNKEKGLGILAFLLIALFGFWRFTTQSTTEGLEPVASMEKDSERIEVSDAQASSLAESEAETETTVSSPEVMVYVDGAVEHPGLYSLTASARVADAIDAAGGLREDGDLTQINPALHVSDEMKITIPTVDEVARQNEATGHEETWVSPTPSSKRSASDAEVGRIDINRADRETLMTLPSIGEVKADNIIAYREQKPFQSVEEIQEVSGIGPKLYAQIESLITVGDD